MTDPTKSSFSPGRKWSIGLNVLLVVLVVLAVVVMVNYLSRDYSVRLQLSSQTKIQLSPRTLSLLHSITNPVKVILYYDKKEPLYTTVQDLLNEYARANPKISVRTVDYVRDPAGAQQIKTDYKLAAATDKDLVIFDCEGRRRLLDGKALTQAVLEQVPSEKENQRLYRRKPTVFEGESGFTAALLMVTSPNPLNAYFLQGHREHGLSSGDDLGYLKFAELLAQNSVHVESLYLRGTNLVPTNCNLLIIAGASDPFFDTELEKIDKYLLQGGRLLVLFSDASINQENGEEKTHLDKVLAAWGVAVGMKIVHDPDLWQVSTNDLLVSEFNPKHPLVNPLLNSSLFFFRPRAIGAVNVTSPKADAPRVDALVFTGRNAVAGDKGSPRHYPLIVAVEKQPPPGVVTERGATRLVVAGNSFFLANAGIDSAGNRDFADSAINWLLDRPQLLEGIGPRPVKEYNIRMTNTQLKRAQWILLAGFPGSVLLLGSAVRLRRRK